MRIAMLLTNPFRPDPRVHKEARSLAQAGHAVTVICWDRQGEFAPREQIDGFELRRLVVRSSYGVGTRQLLYLPRFWLAALRELAALKPDVIHCHDLDTALPGYWYARTHHIPWIFDAHEAYPEATLDLRVNRVIYYGLLWLERQMVRRAVRVITVGHLLAQRFAAMGGRVVVVGNYQPLADFVADQPITRAQPGLRPDEFVVAYIGGFIRMRAILPLIEATECTDAATVLLLGDGPQRPQVEAMLPTHPRVRYLGWVPQNHVPAYTRLADVIYYGMYAADRNAQYSSPNALFNALAAGKPVLTTNVGEIAHIVRQEQCGLVVPEPTPRVLAQAIEQLRDPALYTTMAANAYCAAQEKYNWSAAEAALLQIYQEMA